MNTFEKIKQLVLSGDVKVSEHGYDELMNDKLTVREAVSGIRESILVEDYPDYPKGVSVLLLHYDKYNQPVHVVWGIPRGHDSPAVLITAYKPDPERWNDTFMERI